MGGIALSFTIKEGGRVNVSWECCCWCLLCYTSVGARYKCTGTTSIEAYIFSYSATLMYERMTIDSSCLLLADS
jgi:hypothetical protein